MQIGLSLAHRPPLYHRTREIVICHCSAACVYATPRGQWAMLVDGLRYFDADVCAVLALTFEILLLQGFVGHHFENFGLIVDFEVVAVLVFGSTWWTPGFATFLACDPHGNEV